MQYWQIMAMRIKVVLTFYYFISLLRTILDWTVADEPWKVRARRREEFISSLLKDKTEDRSGVMAA